METFNTKRNKKKKNSIRLYSCNSNFKADLILKFANRFPKNLPFFEGISGDNCSRTFNFSNFWGQFLTRVFLALKLFLLGHVPIDEMHQRKYPLFEHVRVLLYF